IVTGPSNGTVSINPVTGAVTYTPNANYNGPDSFIYNACDNGTPLPALCDTALVTINVTPVNDAPIANDDVNSTPEDTPVSGNVSTNDSDVDGPGATYTLAGGPSNGSVTVNPDGTYTYTPNANFTGTDSFTYSLCDGGTPNLCDTATVTVTVTPVNDPPLVNGDNATTPEDTPVVINVLANDTDIDGSLVPTSVAIVTGPSNGTVSINPVTGAVTYTPNANYNGPDSFIYIACDNGTPLPALCDTALVTINVTPLNDAPVANNDVNSTPEDTPVSGNVSTNDSDVDGPGATYTLAGGPSNGSVTVNPDGTYTYTPNANFTGTDSFTYSLCDGGTPNLCDTATVTVTVTPVNDPPLVNGDNATTPEDTPVVINVLANDTDIDGSLVPTSVAIVTGPSNGTVSINPITGAVTYTPNANYNGPDSFIYNACDNGTPLPALCDTALVTINVTPVNDPPVAVNDFYTTPEDVPVSGNVSTNDSDLDGPGATYTLAGGPSNGSVTVNPDGTFTYTPNLNFDGTDTFTYSLCDGGTPNLCDTATVTISILGSNNPPVANADFATTPEDTPVVISVVSNDTDVDGNIVPNSVSIVSLPSNGSVFVNSLTGAITYTPNLNFNGTDSFIYLVCDDGTPLPSQCDTAVVTVNVTPVNDPPVAVNDFATTPEETPVVINVPSNDIDVDGNLDNTSVTIVSGPTNGLVSVNPVTGAVTYTPSLNFNGTDVFTYSICDTGSPVFCDTAIVNIVVTPVNDLPVITDTTIVSTPEDTPITICIPFTDPDVGNFHNAGICGFPSNGTIVGPSIFNGELCITYTPVTNYNGTDSLCVVICDNFGACDTGIVIINVDPVNDPPVAVNDIVSTPEDTPVAISVLNNDTDVDGNLDPSTVSVLSGPSNGTVVVNNVTGVVTYTPNPDYNGPDVFTYAVCDDGSPLPSLCDTATVFITVTPVNDPPVITDTTIVSTPEDTPITICIPFTDPDVGNF
ncbi:MAG: Ig-like domain-containing protein, partial [Flavobacteriales bacterium]|nr:Ig-like domain-containing protein [Flavobacteriales bacterium]